MTFDWIEALTGALPNKTGGELVLWLVLTLGTVTAVVLHGSIGAYAALALCALFLLVSRR